MADTSPLRWLIGSELQRFRAAARLSLNEAAEQSGITRHKINHMERGSSPQDPEEIAALLATYRVPARDVDRLTTLTARADESTWWAPWAQVVPDWLRTYVGLEALAASEFTFEPTIIPGLLQTEDYAAAVTAKSPRVRADHNERFVGFRMARTRRLTDPDRPLHLHAVITEGALRLAVGSPELRQAQLRHLIEMSKLGNITIQVVRPEDGVHTALAGPFMILNFDDARSIVYAELNDGAVYLQDHDQVEASRLVSRNLREVALGAEQSLALIESMS